MRQLPLEVRLADHARFGNFVPDGNEFVVHELRAAADRLPGPPVWLWGAGGSGRTHLLQAAVAAAGDGAGRPAYLPLAGLVAGGMAPPAALLEGLGDLDLVALDDIERVAGDVDAERALFGLYEQLRAAGGRLIVAAAGPPADTGFGLADLRSRLASGSVHRLRSLDDAGRLAALTLRARFRGLELPEDTARYLLHRTPRGAASLFALLDTLDRESLAARRPLTIPFVRAVLGL